MSNPLYAIGVLRQFHNVFCFSSFSISSIELEHPLKVINMTYMRS